jgi:hypothetical protein
MPVIDQLDSRRGTLILDGFFRAHKSLPTKSLPDFSTANSPGHFRIKSSHREIHFIIGVE